MSIKNFLIKKMLASKLQGVPQVEQDRLFAVIEKNPDFFQKIALEVQEETKKGKDQISATMEIIKKYEKELKNLI